MRLELRCGFFLMRGKRARNPLVVADLRPKVKHRAWGIGLEATTRIGQRREYRRRVLQRLRHARFTARLRLGVPLDVARRIAADALALAVTGLARREVGRGACGLIRRGGLGAVERFGLMVRAFERRERCPGLLRAGFELFRDVEHDLGRGQRIEANASLFPACTFSALRLTRRGHSPARVLEARARLRLARTPIRHVRARNGDNGLRADAGFTYRIECRPPIRRRERMLRTPTHRTRLAIDQVGAELLEARVEH